MTTTQAVERPTKTPVRRFLGSVLWIVVATAAISSLTPVSPDLFSRLEAWPDDADRLAELHSQPAWDRYTSWLDLLSSGEFGLMQRIATERPHLLIACVVSLIGVVAALLLSVLLAIPRSSRSGRRRRPPALGIVARLVCLAVPSVWVVRVALDGMDRAPAGGDARVEPFFDYEQALFEAGGDPSLWASIQLWRSLVLPGLFTGILVAFVVAPILNEHFRTVVERAAAGKRASPSAPQEPGQPPAESAAVIMATNHLLATKQTIELAVSGTGFIACLVLAIEPAFGQGVGTFLTEAIADRDPFMVASCLLLFGGGLAVVVLVVETILTTLLRILIPEELRPPSPATEELIALPPVPASAAAASGLAAFWNRLRRQPLARAGGYLLAIVATALCWVWLSGDAGPNDIVSTDGVRSPTASNLLGIDVQGRDNLARLAAAAGSSTALALAAALLATLIGASYATTAARLPRRARAALRRALDLLGPVPLIAAVAIGAGGAANYLAWPQPRPYGRWWQLMIILAALGAPIARRLLDRHRAGDNPPRPRITFGALAETLILLTVGALVAEFLVVTNFFAVNEPDLTLGALFADSITDAETEMFRGFISWQQPMAGVWPWVLHPPAVVNFVLVLGLGLVAVGMRREAARRP